ncbi:hypothetical protein I79_012153 [Cricetulus griseus]|uniref:Uncharacterized protein n=1 Tax=Cricetulus griseus TaxID=10029 RepID=G3HN23_CRIGR|nr:hypothetical protein I79_012153 [Cricetulus griseus]
MAVGPPPCLRVEVPTLTLGPDFLRKRKARLRAAAGPGRPAITARPEGRCHGVRL